MSKRYDSDVPAGAVTEDDDEPAKSWNLSSDAAGQPSQLKS